MSYQYTAFDGVSLPLFDHSQNHDPMASESTLIDSVGGAYDWRGTGRRKGRRQTIPLKGLYFGETEYLVDETGDVLIDGAGDSLIAGNGQAMLQAQVSALMEKKGVRGSLWRTRLEDDVLQWKTARLLSVSWPRKWEDHAIVGEINCQFETLMEFWHAATATSTTVNTTSGAPAALTVDNAGQVVDDATIAIALTSGTITAVSIVCVDLGISLAWAGSLTSGETLTIDCGAQTVREGSTNSYSGFSLGAAHTAAGWLPLASGANCLIVTTTGGATTVTISHYNQYP